MRRYAPYGISQKTCFDVTPQMPYGIGVIVLAAYEKQVFVFVRTICDMHTEKLSCGDFYCKNCRGFF